MSRKYPTGAWGQLIIAIGICQLAGVVGSAFTFSAIPTWYATLTKPSFSPPNWIFGPAWITLYTLMGIAAFRVWSLGFRKKKIREALKLFLIHLMFNAGWSIVFFGMHSIAGGLVVIFVLWGMIAAVMQKFYAIDRWASYFLIPYLAWVSFATVLNFSLLLLNP